MSDIETLEGSMQEQADALRSGAQDVKRRAQETGEKIRTQAEKTWDDFTETIRRHPAQAIGIALAAGLAIGTAVTAASRRRNSGASEQFKNLAGSGADAWSRVRSGFEDAVCTLKDAVEDAVAKFK